MGQSVRAALYLHYKMYPLLSSGGGLLIPEAKQTLVCRRPPQLTGSAYLIKDLGRVRSLARGKTRLHSIIIILLQLCLVTSPLHLARTDESRRITHLYTPTSN